MTRNIGAPLVSYGNATTTGASSQNMDAGANPRAVVKLRD